MLRTNLRNLRKFSELVAGAVINRGPSRTLLTATKTVIEVET